MHLKAAHPCVTTPQAPCNTSTHTPQPTPVNFPIFPAVNAPPCIQTPPPQPSTVYHTQQDAFSLYWVFPIKPKHDPDETSMRAAACDPCAFPDVAASMVDPAWAPPGLEATICASKDVQPDPWAPFPNVSTFNMLHWQNNESNIKSHAQMNILARCMQEPGFCPADLVKFDSAWEIAWLDSYIEDIKFSPLSACDGWIKTSAKLHVPKEGVRHTSKEATPVFEVEDVYLRLLGGVIVGALRHPNFYGWCTIPYKLFCCSPGSTPSLSILSMMSSLPSSRTPSPSPSSESSSSDLSSDLGVPSDGESYEGVHVYLEVYNSDVMLEADAQLRKQPHKAGDSDDLKYFIVAMVLWSDLTHLTSFGSASLWPVYLYFVNQSKYVRAQPSLFSAHHVAYVPSVSATHS